MRKLLILCILFFSISSYAQEVRTPVVNTPSVSRLGMCGLNREDTMVVPFMSKLAVFDADTTCFLILNSQDIGDSSRVIFGGTLTPVPQLFRAGDTIHVRCAACNSSETTTFRVVFYAGGDPR